jgi:hypothetical protein
MTRQGKMARTQGRKASACHHRHAIGNCHRHRHHRQGIGIIGIGMPSSASSSASACRQGIIIGSSRTAGRSTVAQYSHTDFERVLRCAVMEIF